MPRPLTSFTGRAAEGAEDDLKPVPGSQPAAGAVLSARYVADVIAGKIPYDFHYQPIVDLRQGVVTGYEALVRFDGSLKMGPDKFLQAAARYGQRLELEIVLARDALLSKTRLPANCFLTVNVSPSLLLSPQWDEILMQVPTLSGMIIEITEEELIQDYKPIRTKLARIHGLGGHVAVDDTGSGYASLKHVMELRPNFIKLDRFFIGECHNDRAKAAMIEMIGNAADRLDAWIVAEGIETSAELDELMRLNIPLGQGYYLGRPEPTMRQVSQEVMAAIRSHARMRIEATGIQRHAEECAICLSRSEALTLLAAHAALECAVVIDNMHRPLEIIQRHMLLDMPTASHLMKVQSSSDVKDVLHRALTRPIESRFDSLAMVNELGKFQGIVRLDRLMRAILAADEAIH